MRTRSAEDGSTAKPPPQEPVIPLLEDVVLPIKVPKRAPRKKASKPKNGKHRVAPEDKKAINKAKSQFKKRTSAIIDSLIEEYSVEITRRLREELTSILDELENKAFLKINASETAAKRKNPS